VTAGATARIRPSRSAPPSWRGGFTPGLPVRFPVTAVIAVTACGTAGSGGSAQDPGGLVSIRPGLRGPSGLKAAVGKVQRVALKKAGAGYSGQVLPFLTGIQSPLPLLATPDGALLVGDWKTGKIYRVSRR
jgi:hypothetical protein